MRIKLDRHQLRKYMQKWCYLEIFKIPNPHMLDVVYSFCFLSMKHLCHAKKKKIDLHVMVKDGNSGTSRVG